MTAPTPPIVGQPFRATLFIQGPYQTIAESHWLRADTTPSTLGTLLRNIAQRRQATCPDDVDVVDARLSQENVFRDVSHYNDAHQQGHNGFGLADPAPVAVKVKLSNNAIPGEPSFYNKTLFFGLLPDINTVGAKLDFSPNNFFDFFTAYIDYLVSGPWGFLATTKESDHPLHFVTNIVYAAGPPPTCTVTSNFADIVTGDQITLSRASGKNIGPARGSWVVDKVNDTTVTLRNFPAFTRPPQYTKFGAYRKRELIYVAYNGSGYSLRLINRKRGGRYFVPRGRSKNPLRTDF